MFTKSLAEQNEFLHPVFNDRRAIIKKEDFKIGVEGDMLILRAETKQEKQHKREKYFRNKYNYSSFSRNSTLPDEEMEEMKEAYYENGCLKLVCFKREETKKITALQIAVK